MGKRIDVTNIMLLGAMRRMLQRGEITLEQYATSLRRANSLKEVENNAGIRTD